MHARSRVATLAVATCGALAVSLGLTGTPAATPGGVADALGSASNGLVDPADYVWAPSRGALVDALWGREVAFLSRVAVRAPRDVYRGRVSIAPGGRPLRVESVLRETATPGADEHDLIARGDVLAWAVRGQGGEHGATVSLPADLSRLASVERAVERGSTLLGRSGFDVVFVTPAESLAIELRSEGLVLAIRDGAREGRALVDVHSLSILKSGEPMDMAAVRHSDVRAVKIWRKDSSTRSRSEPATVDAPVDGTLFAKAIPWRAVVTPKLAVSSDFAAPAPVVRAVVESQEGRVVLTGFDPRQLALRVVPGPVGPPAWSGLPGSGRLPPRDAERLVATADLMPVQAATPGAIEQGRVISPLSFEAPRLAADERGAASLSDSGAFVPFGAVQTGTPLDGEPVSAWCEAAAGALVVATAQPPQRALLDKALAPLACKAVLWFADGAYDAAPRLTEVTSSGTAPFAAFVRFSAFPEGRQEPWKASPGRQPSPAFQPAVLTHEEAMLGVEVRVTAFVADRFAWMLRAGSRERSHRAGGSFPTVIEDGLLARALAAVDVGVAQRKRPNGLTIGGSTGHTYASRGAVLFATARGLSLLASSDVHEDPQGDAVELPLTASAGSPTPIALKRGLLQERGDICVLPDGTALVAIARFDSHEATAETLCRLGCSEVAALDRGLDVVPTLTRANEGPLPATHPSTRLIALERGSSMTP